MLEEHLGDVIKDDKRAKTVNTRKTRHYFFSTKQKTFNFL